MVGRSLALAIVLLLLGRVAPIEDNLGNLDGSDGESRPHSSAQVDSVIVAGSRATTISGWSKAVIVADRKGAVIRRIRVTGGRRLVQIQLSTSSGWRTTRTLHSSDSGELKVRVEVSTIPKFVRLVVAAKGPYARKVSRTKQFRVRPTTSVRRVLFIGNSLTYYNNLPKMFRALVAAGGNSIVTEMEAIGDASLADHTRSAATMARLAQGWDLVVLQENSSVSDDPQRMKSQMLPAAAELAARAREAGGEPLLYETWAYEESDFSEMQKRLEASYLSVSDEIAASVVPVGRAWTEIVAAGESGLWQPDGNHPTAYGTYLAACTFYAAILDASPVGLPYTAGMPKAKADTAQRVAAAVVLGPDQSRWKLPVSQE
jgi:hypothetical protein